MFVPWTPAEFLFPLLIAVPAVVLPWAAVWFRRNRGSF